MLRCFDMNYCDFYRLVTTPDDRIVFPVKEDSPPEPLVELKIENKGDTIQLYKVKCTNNELIKIRPPVGILKPGGSATVRLLLLTKEDLPEDDRQCLLLHSSFLPQSSFFLFRRRGLQPRHRRLEHEGADAVGHGQEGAGHQTSLRALRTRIGRKRKMRDDHEVPL
uniref:Major sperm protein n=1 Tax=Meloidogyne incognita TaxID=6306 RepID=A0A914NTA6_MELIC